MALQLGSMEPQLSSTESQLDSMELQRDSWHLQYSRGPTAGLAHLSERSMEPQPGKPICLLPPNFSPALL